MNYNKITWDFHTQKEGGGEQGHVSTLWNLATNKNA
jgi:type VI protein secretion system component Hcp